MIIAVQSGALAFALLFTDCAAPKYTYYFDKQFYGARPSQRETPTTSYDSPGIVIPVQTEMMSSSIVKPLEPLKAVQSSKQPGLRKNRTQSGKAASSWPSATIQSNDVKSMKAQEPKVARKNGWMGISSLLLIVGGLLLLMKSNWEWVGAGMVLTGLVLAIITTAKKEKSKKTGEKTPPKNAGAAKAGLFVLGLVIFTIGVLALIAFFSLLNM